MAEFNIGDRVRLTKSIFEPADDHSPGGYCGYKGDFVIVRRVDCGPAYPYAVSHEDRADGNTFGVSADEIEAPSTTHAASQAGEKGKSHE